MEPSGNIVTGKLIRPGRSRRPGTEGRCYSKESKQRTALVTQLQETGWSDECSEKHFSDPPEVTVPEIVYTVTDQKEYILYYKDGQQNISPTALVVDSGCTTSIAGKEWAKDSTSHDGSSACSYS